MGGEQIPEASCPLVLSRASSACSRQPRSDHNQSSTLNHLVLFQLVAVLTQSGSTASRAMASSLAIQDTGMQTLCERHLPGSDSHKSKHSPGTIQLYGCAVFDVARGLGIDKALQPVADALTAVHFPEVIVHWGHPGNMAIVLLFMGGYSTYSGWQIRTSDDGAVLANAKDRHPQVALAMTFFFTIGAIGGMVSLLMQGLPIFKSAHVWTGISGLLLLYLQGMLSLFFQDDPNARGLHAFLGSAIMALFVVHMGLGLQLGLSI